MNKMKEIRIEKIVLNIGTGGAGEKLEKGMKLLEKIAGRKPVETKAKKRIPTWGVRPGLSVGTKVTLRGKYSNELLKRLLEGINNTLSPTNFDNKGSISFGIPEYIDIPGVEYMSDVGIIGLEVSVTLERRGFRVKERRYQTRKIGEKHNITKEDATEFMKSKFNTNILEEKNDNE